MLSGFLERYGCGAWFAAGAGAGRAPGFSGERSREERGSWRLLGPGMPQPCRRAPKGGGWGGFPVVIPSLPGRTSSGEHGSASWPAANALLRRWRAGE